MNAAIRAHRVLSALSNYRKADAGDVASTDPATGDLGRPVGWYCNPLPGGEVVAIFDGGLAWPVKGEQVRIRFTDIDGITLPDGNQSRELILEMVDGKQHVLPARGERGRFLDSSAMLRFVDRVRQDLGAASARSAS